MNTTESCDLLSDVLLDDERIVSANEREFLAELLRQSETHPTQYSKEITRAIARIAGEVVVQRAGGLVADGILRRLADPTLTYDQRHRKDFGLTGDCNPPYMGPRPPTPTPPSPGPNPGAGRILPGKKQSNYLGPRPPIPSPPKPGPGPGIQATVGPKGILDPDVTIAEFLPPKFVVLEEFMAPAELNDLLEYTLANEKNFIVSEVISPGVTQRSAADFEYRRSHVLMDIGPYQEKLLNRLYATLPRIQPKLGLEPFPISCMEAQITSSKDGDFFRWHSDNGQDEVSARCVTFVYFFHREPKAFEGGELRLRDSTCDGNIDKPGNYYAIVPRQNQVVLFDSSLTHEIAPVKCPSGRFADSRFTVNGWFSR